MNFMLLVKSTIADKKNQSGLLNYYLVKYRLKVPDFPA
jgi:hypothetical protein